MLIGGAALISGAYLLSPSPLASDLISERQWEVSDIIVVAGRGSLEGGYLTITLDERGLAILSLPLSPITSEQYEILHIEFQKAPRDIRVVTLWRTDATGSTLHSKTTKGLTPKSLWLKVREMEDWDNNITELGLALEGDSNGTITLTGISLNSLSLRVQLHSIYDDWANSLLWKHSSINALQTRGATTYLPVSIFAIWFALSALAYACVRGIWLRGTRFDWRVVGGIFLICWICLDIMWQHNLLRRVRHTHETFVGKDIQEKIRFGADHALFRLTKDIRQKISASDARLFVSSEDEYRGMRTAYYLYPLNVYRKHGGPELPQRKHFVAGDYILAVNPTSTRFDSTQEELHALQFEKPLSVEHLFSSATGSLFRVK